MDINLAKCWKVLLNDNLLVYNLNTSKNDYPEIISRKGPSNRRESSQAIRQTTFSLHERRRYGRTLIAIWGTSGKTNLLVTFCVTIMSDSIRWNRSSLEESSSQYERTRRGESLVCRLFRQKQRRVAIFLRDNRWKHLSGKLTLRLGLVSPIYFGVEDPWENIRLIGWKWKARKSLSLPVRIGRRETFSTQAKALQVLYGLLYIQYFVHIFKLTKKVWSFVHSGTTCSRSACVQVLNFEIKVAWWLERGGTTRSHSELGSQTSQR